MSAIYTLLVVRVARFATKSSRTNFSFVAAAARLSKYPSSASIIIGCVSIMGYPPGCAVAGCFIAPCADPNWSLPPSDFFLIVSFLAASR